MNPMLELEKCLDANPKDFIAVLNVSAKDYMRINIEALNLLVGKENLAGVYITLNKPYRTMDELLGENGIDTKKIYFIDCISRTAGGSAKSDGKVFYLDTPKNLTGLGVALGQMVDTIPGKGRFLFLDSLSTLLLYHNAGTVAKFAHFLTGRMRLWGLRGVIISLESETDPQLTRELAQFCDAVIDAKTPVRKSSSKIKKHNKKEAKKG